MKILLFSDTHNDTGSVIRLVERARKEKVDVVIGGGDVADFEKEYEKIVKLLAALNIPVLLVHGNHEGVGMPRKIAARFKNVYFLHEEYKSINNVLFVGYGGGGFATSDPDIDEFGKKFEKEIHKYKKNKLVLILHGPPSNNKLDYLGHFQRHVGCRSRRKFIEKFKPDLVVCGHLHESEGMIDYIKSPR